MALTQIKAGGIANLAVDTAQLADDSVEAAKLHDDAVTSATLPTGGIVQVVTSHNSYYVTQSTGAMVLLESSSGTTWVPTITPTSNSNKILVIPAINFGGAGASADEARGSYEIWEDPGDSTYVRIYHGYEEISTYDYGADGVWNSKIHSPIMLRNPTTTSAVNYQIKWKDHGDSAWYNGADRASSFTMMEVVA